MTTKIGYTLKYVERLEDLMKTRLNAIQKELTYISLIKNQLIKIDEPKNTENTHEQKPD